MRRALPLVLVFACGITVGAYAHSLRNPTRVRPATPNSVKLSYPDPKSPFGFTTRTGKVYRYSVQDARTVEVCPSDAGRELWMVSVFTEEGFGSASYYVELAPAGER